MCSVCFLLEKSLRYRKYASILIEIHESGFPTIESLTHIAKAFGHISPYTSYWAALSLIEDGVEAEHVDQYVTQVEKWSRQHKQLRARLLHLLAELACRTNAFEVRSPLRY